MPDATLAASEDYPHTTPVHWGRAPLLRAMLPPPSTAPTAAAMPKPPFPRAVFCVSVTDGLGAVMPLCWFLGTVLLLRIVRVAWELRVMPSPLSSTNKPEPLEPVPVLFCMTVPVSASLGQLESVPTAIPTYVPVIVFMATVVRLASHRAIPPQLGKPLWTRAGPIVFRRMTLLSPPRTMML